MKKKILCMLIMAAMCIALLPAAALADGEVVLSSETIRLEAEDYAASGAVVTGISNFSGTAGANLSKGAINFGVDVQRAGLYELDIRWGNSDSSDRSVTLKMDDDVLFSGTTGFTWSAKVKCILVDLTVGVKTFSVIHSGNSGNFRVDFLELRPLPVVSGESTVLFEAEDCTDAPQAAVALETDSGGKHMMGYLVNAYFYAESAGAYYLNVKWGNKQSDNKNVTINLNGEAIYSGITGYGGGGSGMAMTVKSFPIMVNAGPNFIEIPRVDNVMVDYFEIAPGDGIKFLTEDGELKFEGEDYVSDSNAVLREGVNFSNGKAVNLYTVNNNVTSGVYTITASFLAEKAGTYRLVIRWGSTGVNTNGEVQVNNTAVITQNFPANNWIGTVSYCDVTLNKGANTIYLPRKSIYVDYIKIIPVPDLTTDKPLRLEAEDYSHYNSSSKSVTLRHFDDGECYLYNAATIEATFNVSDAGAYVMNVMTGGISGDSPVNTIKIDGVTVYNKSNGAYTDASGSNMTEGKGMKISQARVELTADEHTLSMEVPTHALIDYIEFDANPNYDESIYSFELADGDVYGGSVTAALDKTYLGEYTLDEGELNDTKYNTSIKPLGSTMQYVSYPFETYLDANYFLKVTYASSDNSAAVVTVDPEGAGTAVTSGTWQKAYSNEAGGTFYAPYFTEKYFDLGTLAYGNHNFKFAFDSSNNANNGVSIRKVELISEDKTEAVLYESQAQFAAENAGASDSASSAELAESVSAANAYSSASVNLEDKNTVTVIKHVFNNTASTASFKFIAAAYDSNGCLTGVSISDNYTLAAGAQADIKVKVNTADAVCINTFGLNMSSLKPVLEPKLFGQ